LSYHSSFCVQSKQFEGFAHASGQKFQPKLSVILYENVSNLSYATPISSLTRVHQLNDTLVNKMCPKAGEPKHQTKKWQSIYAPPITARLNAAAPGANLKDADTTNLISLCPFETVAHQQLSPFCALFTLDDFQGYEYLMDLEKYYYTG
jgi:hypothetical protein